MLTRFDSKEAVSGLLFGVRPSETKAKYSWFYVFLKVYVLEQIVKFSFIFIKRDLTSNPFVLLIWG